MRLQDYSLVQAVLGRNGRSAETYDEWRSLWLGNPASDTAPDLAMGWILEDKGGQAVGVSHNVPALYCLNGRTLLAAVGRSNAVDSTFRHSSVLLFQAMFSQTLPQLFIATSTIPVAGKLWEAFGARKVPHPSYDQVLVWVADYSQAVASAVFQRWKMKAGWGAKVAGSVTRAWHNLAGRCRTGKRAHEVARVEAFDARFDTLWQRLRAVPDRLCAIRDCRTLTWHFARARAAGTLLILLALKDGVPLGYLIAVREDRPVMNLTRYAVADLQALPDDGSVVESLMCSLVAIAREEKVALVEVVGLDSWKRSILERLNPLRRHLSTWPFFYLSRTVDLGHQSFWDPTPYDGDASLGKGCMATGRGKKPALSPT